MMSAILFVPSFGSPSGGTYRVRADLQHGASACAEDWGLTAKMKLPSEIEQQLAVAFANAFVCTTPGCGWSLDDDDRGAYCAQCRGEERTCACTVDRADLPIGHPVIRPADGTCWNCGSREARHPGSMPSVMQ